MNEDVFGVRRLEDVLIYRKVTIAVVATYLGLDDGFIEAVLADRMEEYLQDEVVARERLKAERYEEYVQLLQHEAIVRYAATAAEALAASPESPLARGRTMGDTGGLGQVDDVHAMVRIHELFEWLESPHAGDEAEKILHRVKRQLCNYYNACAYDLVHGTLLSAIITAMEEWYRQGGLTAARARELVIAGQ